jgi:hypothetical protein
LLIDGQQLGKPARSRCDRRFCDLGKSTDWLIALVAAPFLRWEDRFARHRHRADKLVLVVGKTYPNEGALDRISLEWRGEIWWSSEARAAASRPMRATGPIRLPQGEGRAQQLVITEPHQESASSFRSRACCLAAGRGQCQVRARIVSQGRGKNGCAALVALD